MIMTAISNIPRIIPNSFSISRTAKNERCCSRKIDKPIARGARIKAEIETPKSVFLI
jgi:hypothetical protein